MEHLDRDLESHRRRNGIRIDKMCKGDDETWFITEAKAKLVSEKQLNLELSFNQNSSIRRAMRVDGEMQGKVTYFVLDRLMVEDRPSRESRYFFSPFILAIFFKRRILLKARVLNAKLFTRNPLVLVIARQHFEYYLKHLILIHFSISDIAIKL